MAELELLKLARWLTKIGRVANKRVPLPKSDLELVAREVAPGLEFTGDDWIWKGDKTVYPSETASVSLTERDNNGNIVMTGIAVLHNGFPIVVADNKMGCYLYEDGKIAPVVSVKRIFVDDPEITVRCHIFGQKSTPHWVWMNEIIGSLNEKGIRTDNNMGPYFLLRNFFYYYQKIEEGIEITPMKAVLSEPYSNKPKEEIGAFVINALNQGLSIKDQLFLSDISGNELFHGDNKIKRVENCEMPYCGAGWIGGTSKKDVQNVLQTMNKAIRINLPPDLSEDNPSRAKIKKLISDLNHLRT